MESSSAETSTAMSTGFQKATAAQTAPKARLGVVKLASLAFFAVCGGPFGLEPLVKNGGAGRALLGLVIIPWVYSMPMALMTAELSTAMPESGGYIVWLHRAFGDRWAVQASVWAICNSFLDNAGYPIMFVDYLMEYQARAWEVEAEILSNATLSNDTLFKEVDSEDSLGAFSQWLLGMGMLVPIAAVNLRGAGPTADGAVLFSILVLAPVAVMVAMGLPDVNLEALTAPPDARTKAWGGFLTLLMWNNCGFDSAGTIAAEVDNPGTTFVPAMMLTMCGTTIAYFLPTMVGVCTSTSGATSTDASQWFDGYWTTVAALIGGNWLAAWLTFAGAVSSCGLLNTLLCTTSHAMSAMGRLGYLPSAVGRTRSDGTPYVSVMLNAAAICVLMLGDFETILEANMVTYSLRLVLEFGALLKLRQSEPDMERPYPLVAKNVNVYLTAQLN